MNTFGKNYFLKDYSFSMIIFLLDHKTKIFTVSLYLINNCDHLIFLSISRYIFLSISELMIPKTILYNLPKYPNINKKIFFNEQQIPAAAVLGHLLNYSVQLTMICRYDVDN